MNRLPALLLLGLVLGCDAKAPEPSVSPGPGAGTRDPFGKPAAGDSGGELAYRERRALVVGVADYSGMSKLDGPPHDAADVAATLASRYGFQVELLLDRPSPIPLPAGVTLRKGPLGRDAILARLDALKAAVGRSDALLFYFAGHGLPGVLLPSDATLPSPSDRGTWTNLLPHGELAARLRAADAHHTLLVLDCCFSGSALADSSGVKAAVGTLGPPALRAAERDNLARVFNRRAFQVLAAGAGDESVADLAQVSSSYATRRDLEGHSPFTGVLLEGLRGLTGRPDGKIAASDLGHYLATTLVNENEHFRAKQSPRFGSFGGEGDFLFLPTSKALNPRLVAPLYMAGADYAELRQSAADALARFLAAQPAAEHPGLVAASVAHLARLLRDPEPGPRRAAARTLEQAARLVDPAALTEFAEAVAPLAALAGRPADPASAEAAAALGRLGAHADEAALEAFATHVRATGDECNSRLGTRPLPDEVADQIATLTPPAVAASAPLAERFAHVEARRVLHAWVLGDGLRLVAEHERRHEAGKALFQRASRYAQEGRHLEAALATSRALGIHPAPEDPSPRLIRNSPEWWSARAYLDRAPDAELLWTAGGARHHPDRITGLAASPDGRRLASRQFDGRIRIWDVESGALVREIEPRPRVWALVWAGNSRLVVVDAEGTAWVEDPEGRAPAGTFRTGVRFARVAAPPVDVPLVIFSAPYESSQAWDAAEAKFLLQLPSHVSTWPIDAQTYAIADPERGVLFRERLDESDSVEVPLLEGGFETWAFDPPTKRCAMSDPEGAVWVKLGEGPAVKVLEPAGEAPELAFAGEGRSLIVRRDSRSGLLDLDSYSWRELPGVNRESPLAARGGRIFVANGRAIRVLDARRGTELGSARTDLELHRQVAFDPSGGSALLLGQALERRDAGTGRVLARREESYRGFAFVGRDRVAAVGADSWSLLDLATLEELRRHPLPDGPPLSACVGDPVHGRLGILQTDRFTLVDAATGTALSSWSAGTPGNTWEITLLDLDPSGSVVALGHFKDGIEARDVSTGRRLWTWKSADAVTCAAFHPERAEILVGGLDGALTRLSTEDGKLLKAWASGTTPQAVAWHPSGRWAAEATWSQGLQLWDPGEGTLVLRAFDAADSIASLGLSPDGGTVLLAGEQGAMAFRLGPSRPWDGRVEPGLIPCGEVSRDGSTVRVADQRSRLVELETATGRLVRSGEAAGADTCWLAASPDGSLLLRILDNGRALRVADAGFGTATVLEGPRAKLVFGGFVEDGIVAVDEVGMIHRWELDGTGYRRSDAEEHAPAQPDRGGDIAGHRLAWIGKAGRLIVYDATTDEVAEAAEVGSDAVVLRLSPDGTRAATATREQEIKVWSLEDGKARRRFGCFGVPMDLRFDPTGTLLAVSGNGGAVLVLDVENSRLRASFGGAGTGANLLRWFPDGKRLATVSRDVGFRTWALDDPPADPAALSGAYRHVGLDVEWLGRPPRDSIAAPVREIAPPAPPRAPEAAAAAAAGAGNHALALHLAGPQAPPAWVERIRGELEERGREALNAGVPELAHHLYSLAPEIGPRELRFAAAFGVHDDEATLALAEGTFEQAPVLRELFRIHVLRRLGRDAAAALAAARKLAETDPQPMWIRSLDALEGRLAPAQALDGLDGVARAIVQMNLGLEAARSGDSAGARAHLGPLVAPGGDELTRVFARSELRRLGR